MKAKWHLSAFIILLTLLGISLQQFSVPNQEIVVQFANDEVATSETQITIAIVKKQLQNIGVNNIQVHKEGAGKLKITYYSTIDVASVKKIFSKEVLDFGFTTFNYTEKSAKLPFNKKSNTYKLDVFEIQKRTNNDWEFNDYAIKIVPENDRFFKPKVYFSCFEIDGSEKNSIEKTAYIAHRNNSIAIDKSSHNIPEVRAGPVACLKS